MNVRGGDESVSFRIAWFASHDIVVGFFIGERHCRYNVRAEVDTEDGDGAERQWNANDDIHHERHHLWNVACQCVRDRLAQVVKDTSSCSTYSKFIIQ